jgi:hypothetical protein
MALRHNTVACSFDLSNPRITAYEIHEWIFAKLRIPEHNVQMIHTDGIKRHVYINLVNSDACLLYYVTQGDKPNISTRLVSCQL